MIAACQPYGVEPEQGGEREGDYSIETPIEIPRLVIVKTRKLKGERKKNLN